MSEPLEPGWLQRVAAKAHQEVNHWPEWMRERMGERDLLLLLREAREHVMSPAEVRSQAVSFVYGNLKLSGWKGTRRDVEQAAEALEIGNVEGL